ncbi:MAG: beta-galactosidase [Planctomycetia bacterium]|nr:beta-galactosidase [Planctomycetia bacterium]
MRKMFWMAAVWFLSTSWIWGAETMTLFQPSDVGKVNVQDANVTRNEEKNCVDVLALGKNYQWPGFSCTGEWKLDEFTTLRLDVENTSDREISVSFRADSPETKSEGWFQSGFAVPAGERMVKELSIGNVFPPQLQGKVVGMRGLPGGIRANSGAFTWEKIVRFFVFTANIKEPVLFRVYGITAVKQETENRTIADWKKMSPEEFFPFIDVYGQFKYEDWPGKIHSDEDFPKRIAAEEADWAKNPRPVEWNAYGGWKNGPKLKATGRFRVEKYEGKWWFVDPEGCLFWSHGVDCVGVGNGVTPVTRRENYFENLPAKETPYGKFYGKGWSAIGFYKDHSPYEYYNFTQSNLYRKYGTDFENAHASIAHQRLASWGMNTIGNWSSNKIYGKRQTPYVLTLNCNEPKIEGSTGYWGKFPDPFSPKFRENMKKAISWNKDFLNDPMCLGAFVNNEISWGAAGSLAEAALSSPPTQPVKLAMMEFLKKKYSTIEKLNETWKTTFASWEALLQNADVPKNSELKPDLEAFYTIIAEEYFRVIHEELRAADPQLLDMGCRFAWVNDLAAKAMAKYVDVMSYNFYRVSIADVRMPADIDMPCIVGEFHFGALDRGMFHTGLQGAKDQNDRAEKYANYVTGALENPCIVGTHWFQYGSQATTGRFDGENYQIGLVDLGDTPYPEIIAKVREIGHNMYSIRSKK